MRKLIRNRKGQGLVEYALIIAGVALVAAVGISMFGHKVSDLIGSVAAVLPGAHLDDNGPIASGHLVGTTTDADGAIIIDTSAGPSGVLNPANTSGNNLLGVPGDSTLVKETPGG
jgi:Flp pilus assembly pilin Flp